ncbi:MAG: hypothetical protein ACOVP6_06280 [Lacibacter sp.]
MTICIRQATLSDTDDLVRLNNIWYKPNLTDTENGFLSVTYGHDFFNSIISNEDLLVFIDNDKLVGYVLVNTVIETPHIDNLKKEYFALRPINKTRSIAFSCQILIDKPLQGTGFFYEAQKEYSLYFKKKYELLVSTVSKQNIRSLAAHKKSGWTFIDTPKEYYLAEYQL